MKKNRKKLYIYVTIGLAVLYILFMFLSFITAVKYVSHDQTSQKKLVEARITSGVKYNTCDEAANKLSRGIDDYPFTLKICKDGIMVARNGSWVQIDDSGKKIYLDDYFTMSYGRIADFYTDKNETLKVREISYFIDEDGKYIPSIVTLYMTKNGKVNNDTSSDFKCFGYLTDRITKTYKPTIKQSKVVFVKDRSNRQERLHEKTYFNVQIYINNIPTPIPHSNNYFGRWKVDKYSNYIICGDKKYEAEYYSGIDTWQEALYSDWFRFTARNISYLFVILLIISLLTVKWLYRRYCDQEASRQMFTGAVAHEMKTPLAIIQNQCECVLENVAPEKHDEYINSIIEEAQRMNKSVMTFLQYNRLNSTVRIPKDKFNLSEILLEEIDKYRPLMEKKELNLSLMVSKNIEAIGSSELAKLAIDNYLSNAVKYTEASGRVKILLMSNELAVFNECKGIPKKEQKRIWDLLYREDEARERKENSSGMGLTICRRIFELSDYKYGCRNVEGGVEFYFRIK